MSETKAAPHGRLIPVLDEVVHVIEAGDPAGRPVVFLHGGGPGSSGWTDFSPVLPYFADARVLLPDLLQFGLSSARPIEAPIWTYQAQHLAAALDICGVSDADLVCSSVGGYVALALAAQRPDLVHKVVLTGTEPAASGDHATDYAGKEACFAAVFAYFADPSPATMRELMAVCEWLDGDAIPDEIVGLRHQQATVPEILALYGPTIDPGFLGEWEDLEYLMDDIAAPVLFLWAEKDPFVGPQYADHLASLVPDGHVHVMPDVSHHPFEERPHEYSTIVRAFLNS